MTTIGESDSPDDSLLVIGDVPRHGSRDDPEIEDLESTSVCNSYCGEWEKLFKRPRYLTALRSYGTKGKLRSSRFRSVCWKIYLEVLCEDQTQWLANTRKWREKYNQLKTKLIINPRKTMEDTNLSFNNPLSQETESPWNQFFQDNELRVTIKQDVIRTFPEILFFQDVSLQEVMTDVLFCYAKENNNLSYKQGMHELLAPLIFILHCDHQAFLHACEIETVGEVIREILDPAYVEHDAYAMFYQIMETVEPWYVSKEISPTVKMKSVLKAQPFARNQDLHPSNVIVNKLTRVQNYLLKKFDQDLHAHLEKMDIAPQIYGIRWVRLLFGREFPMQDLLMLWDAIFADGISFDLVDYIFVAMLLYIRDAMLTSDYPSCLHLLMKFPPVGDVHYFVNKALYLREPSDYPRPHNYVYQKPANFGQEWEISNNHRRTGSQGRYNKGGAQINIAEKAATVVSGFSTFTRRMGKGRRPRNLQMNSSPQKMSKSTSEPMNLLTDQSPEDQPSRHDRKGSTASLSQIEGTLERHIPLRGATSTQSLARTEMSLGRSNSTTGSRYSRDSNESTGGRHMTLPSRSKPGVWRGTTQEGSGGSSEYELASLLGKFHDMEQLCQKCAEKMGGHIDKLQKEMLSQQLDNEDELLLALAGLKQVRDVLKGSLKPSSVFNSEEISIHDDHYQNDLMPSSSRQESGQSSLVTTPMTGTPVSDGAGLGDFSPGMVTSSDTDTSPPQMSGSYGHAGLSPQSSTDSSPHSTQPLQLTEPAQEVSVPREYELRTVSVSPNPTSQLQNRANSSHGNGYHSYQNGNDQTNQATMKDHVTVPKKDDVTVEDQRTEMNSFDQFNSQMQEVLKSLSEAANEETQHRQWYDSENQDISVQSRSLVGSSYAPCGDMSSYGGGYQSDLDKQWFQRYHSAPPTPFESPPQPRKMTNVVAGEHSMATSPGRSTSQATSPGRSTGQSQQRPQIALSRKLSSGSLTDTNQNSKKGFTSGFWGQRAAASKDPSAMNKISDLFKGAFKF